MSSTLLIGQDSTTFSEDLVIGSAGLVLDADNGWVTTANFDGTETGLNLTNKNYVTGYSVALSGSTMTGDLLFNKANGTTSCTLSTETGNLTTSGNISCTDISCTDITVSGLVDGVDIAARDTLFGALTSSSTVLTDGVTATTQAVGDNSTKVATTEYTDRAITNLIDSSPAALDTLNELAAAINDDASFSTTMTNLIATKLPLAGGTLTGPLTVGAAGLVLDSTTGKIVSAAVDGTEADLNTLATIQYVNNSSSSLYLPLAGGTLTGPLTVGAAGLVLNSGSGKIVSAAVDGTETNQDTLATVTYVKGTGAVVGNGLSVSASTGANNTDFITGNTVGVLGNAAKGIEVDSSTGVGVVVSDGISVSASGVAVVGNAAKGIEVDSSTGVGLVLGEYSVANSTGSAGLEFNSQGALQVKTASAKGIKVTGDGLETEVQYGIANSATGLTVVPDNGISVGVSGVAVVGNAAKGIEVDSSTGVGVVLSAGTHPSLEFNTSDNGLAVVLESSGGIKTGANGLAADRTVLDTYYCPKTGGSFTGSVNFATNAVFNAPNDTDVCITTAGTVSASTSYVFAKFTDTSAAEVGSITVSHNQIMITQVSDYRLKENFVEDWNAVEKLMRLQTYEYTFKSDPTKVIQGFKAHEVQEVIPDAVIGEKDAVDDFGENVYQQVDQSKLIPMIVKTLQESHQKITDLETKLAEESEARKILEEKVNNLLNSM
jgi:hypothetical protein